MVYFPNTPDKLLLVLDLWTNYKDQQVINEVKLIENEILIKTISPKETGLIQPLDRFF